MTEVGHAVAAAHSYAKAPAMGWRAEEVGGSSDEAGRQQLVAPMEVWQWWNSMMAEK